MYFLKQKNKNTLLKLKNFIKHVLVKETLSGEPKVTRQSKNQSLPGFLLPVLHGKAPPETKSSPASYF